MATTFGRRRLLSLLLCRPSPLAALRPPPLPLPSSDLRPFERHASNPHRHFSSKCQPPRFTNRIVQHRGDDESDSESDDDKDYEDGTEQMGPKMLKETGRTEAQKAAEADEIGYRVLGSLDATENPFKPYEPIFAVVQIGSHQFKVSNGDSIFAERLKYCQVNDKLVLNRVLMLGSATQTIIGRPTLPEAAVFAVVEEHALDAKVIIFKKKRRKNYRRTKGHRQELTKLRITDIQGIEKPLNVAVAA